MALLGRSAVVIWSDMQDPPAHDHWHSHEHLLERMAIPGFLRARRMATTEAGVPQYFVVYEVRDAAVMTSPAYLARLNSPSAWTQRTMAQVRSLNRTLCDVKASSGHGVGAHALTLPFAPRDGEAAALRRWIDAELLSALASQPGFTGVHLLERDRSTDRPPTEEERLRGKRDAQIDSLLIVEGYEIEGLRALAVTLPQALAAQGAAEGLRATLYHLAHTMTAADMAPAA
jgi:hypothetical protein